ncbi:MAG: metallophosphoesterase [Deltaproteobacteria bacterium]|nr:metallophosphoesterase [Deltaproteobacteria bacterium]
MSIVLGVVLTFTSTDGRSLALDVTLASNATVSVELEGRKLEGTLLASDPFTAISFGPFGLPTANALATIRVAGESPIVAEIPARRIGRTRVAIYGDSRDGDAPHRILSQAIREAEPDVLIHTGDLIRTANDEQGFAEFLAALWPQPTEEHKRLVPLVIALGNHEVLGPGNGLDTLLASVPVPPDRFARANATPPAVFHVNVGPVRIISIDSNSPMAAGSRQYEYLGQLLGAQQGQKLTIVAMHHGPLSSGVHGGHPDGAQLMELFQRKGVDIVAAGHDHLYERIVSDRVTVLVSGGGGAPLYWRTTNVPGSIAFAPTHHYVLLDVDDDGGVRLEARSLEGVLLDRAKWRGAPESPPNVPPRPWASALGLVTGLAMMGYVGKRILFRSLPK